MGAYCCILQVGCHKETDNVHLVMTFEVYEAQLTWVNHKNAVCFHGTTFLQSVHAYCNVDTSLAPCPRVPPGERVGSGDKTM